MQPTACKKTKDDYKFDDRFCRKRYRRNKRPHITRSACAGNTNVDRLFGHFNLKLKMFIGKVSLKKFRTHVCVQLPFK